LSGRSGHLREVKPRTPPDPQHVDRGPGRRDVILDAAVELFRVRGFSRTGINEIGAAVGMSGAGIYRHFDGKDDILAAVIEHAASQLFENVNNIIETHRPPLQTVVALVQNMIAAVLGNRALAAVMWKEHRHLSAPARQWADDLHDLHAASWLPTLHVLRPELWEAELRARVDAVQGLIMSVAEIDGGLRHERLTELLTDMAMAVLIESRARAEPPGSATRFQEAR